MSTESEKSGAGISEEKSTHRRRIQNQRFLTNFCQTNHVEDGIKLVVRYYKSEQFLHRKTECSVIGPCRIIRSFGRRSGEKIRRVTALVIQDIVPHYIDAAVLLDVRLAGSVVGK